ncbi:MAG: hypothetical protein JSV09_07000 [Thermoplasmata archaeon]|nr:MAG: hypothetical protein JSV09_07000 [Thermoplasmata archaeon]
MEDFDDSEIEDSFEDEYEDPGEESHEEDLLSDEYDEQPISSLENIEDEEPQNQIEDAPTGASLGWIKSKLGKIHPVFLIAAVIATILIEWIMIVLQSYEDLPTVWIGLGVYLIVTVLSVALLTHLFSTKYKTLMSVLTINSLLLTIPLGAVISLATGYTFSQLFSPEWLFTHDFVYVMIVTQLVVTTILMFGIWWKTRKEVVVQNELTEGSEDHEQTSIHEQPSLTHSGNLYTQKDPNRTEGLTNGLTNGLSPSSRGSRFAIGNLQNERGMVNGLTYGLTNGLTKGLMSGVTNGVTNGLTNGLNSSSRGIKNNHGTGSKLARSDRQLFLKRTKQIVFPIVLLLMIVGVMYLPSVYVPSNGYMAGRDWSGVASYSDENEEFHSNADIIEYSATVDEDYLWARAKVKGKMFGNEPPDTNTVFVFIDSDRDLATGYSIGGMGSDYMIRTSGYSGIVRDTTVFEFSETRAVDDWNGWLKVESAETIIEDDTLQTRIPLSIFDTGQAPLVYFGSIDTQGSQDYSSAPIDPNSEGMLIVNQRSDSPDILEKGEVTVLRLEMTARGKPIVVESIDFDSNQKDMQSLPTPIHIDEDETEVLTIRMDTSELVDGEFVEVQLNPAKIVTDNGSVFVEGNGLKAYAGSAPSSIKIDGAFGDWIDESDPPISEGSGEAVNPNVDIQEYQTSKDEDEVFFYIGVDGTMMGGVKIPQFSEEHIQPQPRLTEQKDNKNQVSMYTGTPEFIPLPELTGYDMAHVFIDTDDDKNTGYRPIHPFLFPIGADYMIEIKGRDGIIKSSNYFEFDGEHNEWSWTLAGNVSSACDQKRLEMGISLAMLNIEKPLFDAYIHITDWNEDEDYSDIVIGEGPVNYHTSTGTRKNNGFPDGDIDIIDGGSCAGAFGCHNLDSTQIPISLSWDPPGPYDPGQTGINITVTVDMDNAAAASETGLAMRVGPSGGMPHYGIENDGWVIENDPHNNTNNFIMESNLQGQGPTDFVWTVTAPTTAGTYYVEASVQYDNGGGGTEYNITAESTVTVIPEFQGVLIPAFSILLVVIVGRRAQRSRMKRESDED